MRKREIKYICNAVKWFDKVNGNTYHSVRITRCKDNAVIVGQFQYGYGNQYEYTAFAVMLENKWLSRKYNKENCYLYERENNYPIAWYCVNGLKKECIANGTL